MKLVDFAELTPTQLQRAREIYEANFPPELRSPFKSLSNDLALGYLDDEVRGISVLRAMPSTGWVFLRYYVIGEQGRGIGSRMWADLCERFIDRHRIVLDVESPDEPGISATELDQRLRRIRFYQRLGVQVLPVRSYLPPHDDGHQPAMLLLARDLDNIGPPSPFSAEEVRRIVVAAYRDRYGLEPDDAIVVRTLADSELVT